MRYLLALVLTLSFRLGFSQNQQLNNSEINECSGLVVSSKSDHLMWVHNDSGDGSQFFLVDDKGTTLTTYKIKKM